MATIHLHRPVADRAGEWTLTAYSIITAMGDALGDHYDAYMRDRIGPNWLFALGKQRGEVYELYDVGFSLKEPARYGDSPLRECLPRTADFLNRMDDALRLRNQWIHRHVQPTREAVLALLDVYQPLAAEAGLSLPAQYKELRAAVKAAPDEPVETDAELLERYRREAEAAEAARKKAERDAEEAVAAERKAQSDVDELISDIEQLERRGSQNSAVRKELEAELSALQQRLSNRRSTQDRAASDLRAAMAALVAEKAELEAALAARDLQASAAHAVRDPNDSPYAALSAGDPWPEGGSYRQLTLSSNFKDLFDAETGSYLGMDDPVAKRAAVAWLEVLPLGGAVYVADDVFAGAYVGATLVHLGRLDVDVSGPDVVVGGPVTGFFRPGRFELLVWPDTPDLVERVSGWSLAMERGEAGADIAAELAEAYPHGGSVSITTDGIVAAYVDDAWVCIGST